MALIMTADSTSGVGGTPIVDVFVLKFEEVLFIASRTQVLRENNRFFCYESR